MSGHVFDWISPSATQYVALALLHFLWQGTLIAIVLAAILRLLRDQVSSDKMVAADDSSPALGSTRASLRYAIACFGLLVMCVLPVVNLLVIAPPADTAAHPNSAVEASDGFLEAPREHFGDLTVIVADSPAPSTMEVEPAITMDTRGEDVPVSPEPDEGAAVAPSPAPWAHTSVLQRFFWIWLVGVAVLSVWHLAGWSLSQMLRGRGATPSDDVLALVGRIARRLGIHRAVVVRQTLKAAAPMVIGWLKPALVLPASILTGLAPGELEAVLAHELAHVRRHDYLVNLVQTVVETLLFYHPAVWWLSCRIRSEREFCADDLAIRVCQRRDVYARSLVALAEIVRTPSHRAVAATGGRFLARIRRIIHLQDQRSPSRQFAGRSAMVAVMATACLGIVLIAVAQSKPPKNKPLSGDVESESSGKAANTARKQHVSADDPKEDSNAQGDSAIELLQGTWRATSFRTSDEEFNRTTRTQAGSFSIVIAGDRFTWKYANGREKHWRIKVSPDTDPKQIDFSREDSDTRRLGIYSLKKNELTICFSTVEPVEEGRRPTDFTTEEGSGRILMTAKRPSGVTASKVRADQSKGSSLDVRLIDPATEKPFSYGGVELTRTGDSKSPSEKLRSSLSGDVFKFADLSPGKYTLHASVRSLHPDQPRYVADRAISEVEIVAGEDKEISVRMRPAPLAKDEIATRWPYVTRGTVTDDQGKPIEGVGIYVYVGSGGTIEGWRGATTDAQGNYTLRYSGRSTGLRPPTPPLLQSGSFRVWKDGYVEKNLNRHAGVVVATRPPQEQDWEQYRYLRKDPSRVVLPNQPHRIDFVMVPEVVIAGKLVDGQGVPPVKKRVHITVNQDERLGSDFTDHQGDFQFKRIPPGRAVRFVAEYGRRREVRSTPISFERSGQHRIKLRLAIDAETETASLEIDGLTDPEAEASLKAKNAYSEVERFLTIAPADLPDGCKLSEPRGALLAPKGVVLDRKQVAHVAAFFGIVDPLQLKEVQAAVTVVYEEAGARKGIEIGVYALAFSDGQAGKRLADRFAKIPARDGKHPAFIRKGSLVLHVWRDEDASDSAFEKICKYYRTTEFNWPKPTKGGKSPDGSEPSSESNDRIAKPPSPAVDRLDDRGFASLHRAASGGHVDRATELLESGADVNVRQAKFQGTPLQYAASWGRVEVVRVLLDNQAKIDATDIYGRTPLMWAAMKGKTKTASLLLDRGANVNAGTKSAWTPLHYAVDEKHAETAQLLIDHGADVAARNSLGKTPRELSGDLKLRWPASATFGKNENVPDAKQPTPPSDKPAESGAPGANSGQGQKTPVGQTSQKPGPPAPREFAGLPDYVSTALRWLPVDTETLIVAKDFSLPDARPQARKTLGPARTGRLLAVWPLPDPIRDALSEQRVRWAIHGGRNYEVVSAFGSLRQEGASLIRFDDELSEKKLQELCEQLRIASEDVRSMSGHDVYVFPPDRSGMEGEPKPWQGQYVVFPNAATMITAFSDVYLSQFLARMRAGPGDFALPVDLPEWKYVDTSADVWLLRHLPEQNDQIRRLLPDAKRKLSGFVWTANAGNSAPFRAIYLPLPGKNVEDIARAPWIKPPEKEIPDELAGLIEFTTAPDGVVTMTFPRAAHTPAEIERLRKLAQQLQESEAKVRLLVYFTFYLGSSQGMLR